MIKPILAWHFLREDRKLQFPPHTLVEPGQTLRVEPPLRMCRHGLHASARAIDALRYAPGDMVCRVRLSGEILTDEDKLCASERTVLWMVDATTTLHEFACWCAEQALEQERAAGREPDPRSWAAIKTKRAWLRGECDDATLAAAEAAAEAAARAAARAAADAAVGAAAEAAAAAARAAAEAAAWSAARAAAWAAAAAARAAAEAAAWSAARAAVREEQNAELERRLMELGALKGEKGDG